MVAISFLILRKKEPDLKRPYVVKNGNAIGIGAMVSALFFLYWYTPFSPNSLLWPYEWFIILGWAAVGIVLICILYFLDLKESVSEAEREMLIFGEEYSREL